MELGENKKKLIAIFIIVVILLGIAGIVMVSPGKPPEEVPPEVEEYSFIFQNYPVTDGDLDNNEPSIAINPQDRQNMVAGSNDYNTPQGDAWPGYYTTHDGGQTWSQNLIPGYPGDSRTSQLTGFRGGGEFGE